MIVIARKQYSSRKVWSSKWQENTIISYIYVQNKQPYQNGLLHKSFALLRDMMKLHQFVCSLISSPKINFFKASYMNFLQKLLVLHLKKRQLNFQFAEKQSVQRITTPRYGHITRCRILDIGSFDPMNTKMKVKITPSSLSRRPPSLLLICSHSIRSSEE
jgi:hypothetical protein